MSKLNISNIPGRYEIYNDQVSLELIYGHDKSMYLNIYIDCVCWKVKIQKIDTAFVVQGGLHRKQTYQNIAQVIRSTTMFIDMLATKDDKGMFACYVERVITELITHYR